MNIAEIFTRILFFAVKHLGMTIEEALLMPYGLLNDFREIWLQENGFAKPRNRITIDNVVPEGI